MTEIDFRRMQSEADIDDFEEGELIPVKNYPPIVYDGKDDRGRLVFYHRSNIPFLDSKDIAVNAYHRRGLFPAEGNVLGIMGSSVGDDKKILRLGDKGYQTKRQRLEELEIWESE